MADKKTDSQPASLTIADGPAKDREVGDVIPADSPDSFPYIDGLIAGEYVKDGSSYKYRTV